jgi:hypothetical protein
VSVGRGGRACAEQLAPYLTHRRTGRPWVVLKLAATSTAAPRRPTAPASGSPARPPGSTPTACGPRATPCSSAPAPCGPTTRRSRCATSGARPAAGRARAGAGGAKVHPCLELEGDLGGPRRARPPQRAPGAGRGGRVGGPRLPPRRPGRPLRALPGAGAVRRRRRPRPCSPDRGRPPSTTCGGAASWRHRSATTTTCEPDPERIADVHRHRGGARHGGVSRRAPSCASPPTCSTTPCSATPSPSTAAASRGGETGTGWWEADVSDETLRRTNLGDLARRPGEPRAAGAAEDRLGGHLVQGHVDASARSSTPCPTCGCGCPRAAPLRGGEGLDHRRRREPHGGRRPRRRLHRRRHPPHRRRSPRSAATRARAIGSTSRST